MRASRLLPLVTAQVLLVLSGCPKRVESPTRVLDEAAEAAGEQDASGRTLALAGFRNWLVEDDPEKAGSRFDEALKRDPGEPWAHCGQLLLAQRAAQPARALEASFQILEQAPTHPLSATAARTVLDTVGTSTVLDQHILDRTTRILTTTPPPGDASQLLRSALATLHGQRIDAKAQSQALRDMGVIDRWTLVGPFSAFQFLEFDVPQPPETTGSLAGPFTGPDGALTPRTLHFPDGRVSLAPESSEGGIYLLAADFTLDQPGEYIVRSVSSAAHKVLLDGTPLIEQRSFVRATSTVGERGVQLEPGIHRLLLKLTNDAGNASISVSLVRADGRPTDLRFTPAEGAAPSWTGVTVVDLPFSFPTADSYAAALAPEAGDALAQFVAIRDALGRDSDGGQRLMSALGAALPTSSAVSALRAELSLHDRSLPARVANARATRDLEAALSKDKGHVQALITRARLALNDGRHLEAAQLARQARAAQKHPSHPVALLRAHVDEAMRLDAQAEAAADEALGLQPGLCDALSLQYDLARRRDAVARADEIVQKLEGCPGSRTRLAEHARTRGRNDEAIRLYEALLAMNPSSMGTVQSLVGLLIAQRRFDDAAQLLTRTLAQWPGNAELLERLGDVYEYAGRHAEALAAREAALKTAGGDLWLRRQVHRAKTGKELLSEHAIDGAEAIRQYEARPGREDARSVLVLDAAAVQVFEDGSMVDRIHIIQKALTQEGIEDIAEVSLPPGAQVLALRTIKADGTVLEPEDIEGKDTISMPGVQVGDYVQQEYLMAHARRGPAQPGFTAAAFYFQLAGVPNAWSTYVVSAPKDLGMTVDAHNVRSPQPRIEGDQSVYRHEQRHVPPWIPEPDAPPSGTEFLPWVQLGAGTRGNDALVAAYADAFIDRGRVTNEIEAFAKAAAGGRTGLDAVRAVYAAVHGLQGRDAGLTHGAAPTIAQGRGSRLWALKASLEAIGIPARIAAIRTFFADPSPHLFPNESLIPYVAVRATPPGGQHVWLDTAIRNGPFGELPESAQGCEAWLFPEPGRPLEKVMTPKRPHGGGKEITLNVTLTKEGALSGTGQETYTGFDAAQLTEALEGLAPDQRKQALQSALSRYFGGAEMENLELSLTREVGAPLVVRYAFKVPDFARKDGERLVLGPIGFPAQLGRRYVQIGARTTPLFIDSTERTTTRVTLKLPAGYVLDGPIGELAIDHDFGRFVRREKQTGDTVEIEEEYRLPMMRLPPARYDDFAHFAGQVDLVQTRDLLVVPR